MVECRRRRAGAAAWALTSLLGVSVLSGCSWFERVEVVGKIGEYYSSEEVREALGEPEENERCGLKAGGCTQPFEHGVIFWSPKTKATHVLDGPVLDLLESSGGPDGALGYPVGRLEEDDAAVPDAQRQLTEDPVTGAEHWVLLPDGEEEASAVLVTGAIGGYWREHQEELGEPAPGGPESCDENGICRQSFEHADLMWSPEHGTHRLEGRLREGYEDWMGAPVTDERVLDGGGVVQEFAEAGADTRHLMRWTREDGVSVRSVSGRIGRAYREMGGVDSGLGLPTGEEVPGLAHGGIWQTFERGAMYFTPRVGAVPVLDGPLRQAWQAQGSENGAWGYPVEAPVHDGAAQSQRYQGGTLRIEDRGFQVFQPSEALSGQEEQLLGSVTRQYGLGEPSGSVQQAGDTTFRGYQHGIVVSVPGAGVMPMSTAVFRTWQNTPKNTGQPLSSAVLDGVLHTRFTGGTLAHIPDRGDLVMRTNVRLGAGDALIFGDSQLLDGNPDGSWVSQAIRANGWTPHYQARGGIGVAADGSDDHFGSYYQGIVDRKWVLPSGSPGLVYIQGSGNDTRTSSEQELREKTAQTIRKLREAYPDSRIVLTGVISKKDATRRNRVSDVLEQVAREQGVTFIPLKGKVTEWKAEGQLADGVHFKAPGGHDYMAAKYTPYLAQQLGR